MAPSSSGATYIVHMQSSQQCDPYIPCLSCLQGKGSLSKSSSSSGRTHRRTLSAVRQEQLQELQQQEQQQQQQRQQEQEQQEEEALGGVVRDDSEEEGITRLVVPDDAFSTDNRRCVALARASCRSCINCSDGVAPNTSLHCCRDHQQSLSLSSKLSAKTACHCVPSCNWRTPCHNKQQHVLSC